MIGKTINNYKILKHLGTGGMGAVYLAEDQMLGRKVAIKMLHAELLLKKDLLERFKTEAKTLAKLNHPNIAILFNLIESGGNYFMIMEYVDGDSLETMLVQNGAIVSGKAIDIVIQALEGIQHAHQRKIIHRDLKPANLMTNNEGVVKVMDFGIARALGSARMTREGSVVGTLEYMAPEQIRGKEGDERSDIYAMGIVLYELLTGNVPYRSKSDYDLMTKKLNEKPPEIRSFWHEIPKSLEKVVMKAIKQDPDLRFQTSEQFKLALKECKEEFFLMNGNKGNDVIIPLKSKENQRGKNILNGKIRKLIKIPINARLLVYSLIMLLLIVFVGNGAYKLRQKRLAMKKIDKTDNLKLDKNLLNNKNESNTLFDAYDGSVENKDFESSSKMEIPVIIEKDKTDDLKKKKKEKTKKVKLEDKSKKIKDKNNKNKEIDKKAEKKDKNNLDKSEKEEEYIEDNQNKVVEEKKNKIQYPKEKKEKKKPDPVIKKTKTYNAFIRKNTQLIINLPQRISSQDVSMKGKDIVLYVDKPFVENGIEVISQGDEVYCSINEIKPGKGRKRGTIEIEANYILVNGKHIPLKAAVFRYVGNRGENVFFKKGQRFKVRVAKDMSFIIKY